TFPLHDALPIYLAGLLPAEIFESSHKTIDIRIIVEYDLNIKKSIGNGEAADTPGGRHPHEEDSMAINLDSEETKHIITGYEHWVNYGNGRGGLHAYTLCGWLYLPDRMEGGHAVGDWWTNPAIRNVCEHCRHAVACRTEDAAGCEGCQAAEEDAKLGHPAQREKS